MKLTVWKDDTADEIIERLKLVLIEFGVNIKQTEIVKDCTIYELTEAPRLDGFNS